MMRITPVVLNLLLINGVVFLIELVLANRAPDILLHYFILGKLNVVMPHPPGTLPFVPMQLVTYFFSHSWDSFGHILFNMLALYMIGVPTEMAMGSKRFLSYYLFSGVVGGLLVALLDPTPNPVLGASGAISGVFLAFALLYPNERLIFFPILIPIKAKNLMLIFLAITLFFVIRSYLNPYDTGSTVSHFGHLSGMVAGFIYLFGRRYWHQIQKRR